MKKPQKTAEKKVSKINLKPMGDRVLVKAMEAGEMKSPSGIIIPGNASKEEKQRGEIVAVGRGSFNTSGQLVPIEVKVGDKVLFRANDWDKEKIDGEEYYLVSESSILGVIK